MDSAKALPEGQVGNGVSTSQLGTFARFERKNGRRRQDVGRFSLYPVLNDGHRQFVELVPRREFA